MESGAVGEKEEGREGGRERMGEGERGREREGGREVERRIISKTMARQIISERRETLVGLIER